MFPSQNSTAHWPGPLYYPPVETPRDNRPAPVIQGVNPTTRRPVQKNGALTTRSPDKVPRDNGPTPEVLGGTLMKYRIADYPRPPRPTKPAKPANIPRDAPRSILPAPALRTTPTEHQPANPPGPSNRPVESVSPLNNAPRDNRPTPVVQRAKPAKEKSVKTPGSARPPFKFIPVAPNDKLVTVPTKFSHSFADNSTILVPNV